LLPPLQKLFLYVARGGTVNKQLTLFKWTYREAGRKGYLATIKKMGKEEFHSAGGRATARMDLFNCPCHGTGITAYSSHNKLKGKKHRYATS
jgi:hypothetical protein